jgi:hypothetical protein
MEHFFTFGPSTLHLAITLTNKVLACGPLLMDNEYSNEDSDSFMMTEKAGMQQK